jgi:hypothetical protein
MPAVHTGFSITSLSLDWPSVSQCPEEVSRVHSRQRPEMGRARWCWGRAGRGGGRRGWEKTKALPCYPESWDQQESALNHASGFPFPRPSCLELGLCLAQ